MEERHVLTDIDDEARTATCSTCGPGTRIWRGGARRGGKWVSGRWRCSGRVRAQVSRAQRRDPILERVRKLRGNGVEITVDQYLGLVERQQGRCAICRSEMTRPQVDHCHQTGRVRGLLCVTCNTGLGKFGDNVDRLHAAIRYLAYAGDGR